MDTTHTSQTSSPRRTWKIWSACALGFVASACSSVMSGELKTTAAVDLKLVAQIREDRESSSVPVRAQMQTSASGVGVQFTNGESLLASCDNIQGEAAKVLLSLTNDFLGADFDHYYESSVARTKTDGNYYLTYTDSSDASTTVNIPTGSVAPLLTPSDNAIVAPNTVHLTWDPTQMPANGEIVIAASYQGSNSSGYALKNNVPNTGAYDLELSWFSGTGTIKLASQVKYAALPGFAKSDVLMENFDEITVQYSGSADASAGVPAGSKSLVATGAVVNDEFVVDALLHECLHQCETGETAGFTVGEVEYSCCMEE